MGDSGRRGEIRLILVLALIVAGVMLFLMSGVLAVIFDPEPETDLQIPTSSLVPVGEGPHAPTA